MERKTKLSLGKLTKQLAILQAEGVAQARYGLALSTEQQTMVVQIQAEIRALLMPTLDAPPAEVPSMEATDGAKR